MASTPVPSAPVRICRTRGHLRKTFFTAPRFRDSCVVPFRSPALVRSQNVNQGCRIEIYRSESHSASKFRNLLYLRLCATVEERRFERRVKRTQLMRASETAREVAC